MANRLERTHRPCPASRARARARERSSSSSGELACSANRAQSSCTRVQAVMLRMSAASQAESSGHPSRSFSASRTRQTAAWVRREMSSLSLMSMASGQMNHGLHDMLLDGALPYAVQGCNVLLLHILESEQNKNLTG